MYDNIKFINNLDNNQEYTNTEHILVDIMPGISKYKNIDKIINHNIIGIDICSYFGFNSIIKSDITKDTINFLLENIVVDNKLNSLISYYYTKNNYEKSDTGILLNIYNDILSLHSKIKNDCEMSYKKKYDLDIINKGVVEYFESNMNQIMSNFFIKIKVFYILSIILNKSNDNYLLYLNNELNNKLKFLLGIY